MEVQTSEYPVSNLRRKIVSKYHGLNIARLHDILFPQEDSVFVSGFYMKRIKCLFVFRILETPTDVSNR